MPPVIVMGVCGSGKSTVGAVLAQRLHAAFLEGDAFHPPANVARMAAGVALTDDDRRDWLRALSDELGAAARAGRAVVLSCSALKRSYRDLLREHAPTMLTVFASGDIDLIQTRITARRHEYMPPSLLRTQFDDLEERAADEPGTTVDIANSPEHLVDQIIAVITERSALHAG